MMTNDDRDDLLLEMRDAIARIEEACKPCRAMVQEHHVALDGSNGTAGHKARLAMAETTIVEVARSLSDAWCELTWMRRSLIVGLCVLLLSMVGGVLGIVLPRIL